ncbi:hypothetical protein MTP02_00260 [Streptomyces albus]|nr:hypothetical protein MTP02_00260 [Streptomyces albus]
MPALTPDDGAALLRTVLGRPPAHYVLSATAQAKGEPMTAAVEPETGLWPHLAAALRKILHVTEVSPDDDLLEMGLDSMMAVELAAALSGSGLDVDPMVFFEHSRVSLLLASLEKLPRSGQEPEATVPAPAPAPAVAPVAPAPPPPPAPEPHRPPAPAAPSSPTGTATAPRPPAPPGPLPPPPPAERRARPGRPTTGPPPASPAGRCPAGSATPPAAASSTGASTRSPRRTA